MCGAEPLAWSVGKTDLLWRADPAVWAQTAPILFPVVGWTRAGQVCHRGQTYSLGLHGFAAGRDFAVVERRENFVRLRLEADAETLRAYPFAFRLDAIYRLEAHALVWTLEATNLGSEPMPYALGLHPGFCWPLAGAPTPHAFIFDALECNQIPVIAPGGLFSPERRGIPLHGRRLDLTPQLMAQEALCFLDIASRGAVFDNGAGQGLRVELEDFPHLALWARPPAPFLCIEAWTGHGDPVGFAGELADKPSMRLLQPGATGRHSARFSLENTGKEGPVLGAAAPI
ncbi:MAG: aldose 1-epimerase family protein [Rhodoblastus sp.]